MKTGINSPLFLLWDQRYVYFSISIFAFHDFQLLRHVKKILNHKQIASITKHKSLNCRWFVTIIQHISENVSIKVIFSILVWLISFNYYIGCPAWNHTNFVVFKVRCKVTSVILLRRREGKTKLEKMHGKFLYIHFCYVFMSGRNISGMGVLTPLPSSWYDLGQINYMSLATEVYCF